MRRTGQLLPALLALAVGTAAAVAAGPRPPSLDLDRTSGDGALAERLVTALGGPDGHGAAAVAWVEDGEVTTAAVGASPTTPFEIGSVTKGLTGMLLADAAERGEVRLDEPVGGLVPGTALEASGAATLQELATHRSGLPRLEPGLATLGRSLAHSVNGSDPYVGGPREVLDAAGAAGAPGGAEPLYSNLGAAVLGDALAERTGLTYADLLQQRIVQPLGLRSTTVAADPSQVPDDAARGTSSAGLAQAPWVARGWAPAGVGTWSSAQDLGVLAAALLEGTAPGAAALDPLVADDDGTGDSTGLAWVTSPADPATGLPETTWHNGATGGARSYVGLDRAGGRAVVVLATGTDDVDAAGERLLAQGAR